MMKMHALPDGWQKMKFDEFLPLRRKLIADVIKRAYKKL